MDPYAQFVDDLHRHLIQDSNYRVNVGILEGIGCLPDPSSEAEHALLREARALLARLPDAALAAHSFDQRLDLDLARQMLEREILFGTLTIDGRTRHQLMPRAGDDLGDPIFLIFINDPRPAVARLRDITTRLEGVPVFLDKMLARLDHPLDRWVEIEQVKLAGLPELFATVRAWAAQESWDELPRLDAAIAVAEQHIRAYSQALAALPRSHKLHMGDLLARQVVANAGIDLSLEELHRIARDFLAQNQRDVEELRVRLVRKYGLDPSSSASDLQELLAERFRVALPSGRLEDVLLRYQGEREKILRFIRDRDLFPVPEDQEMLILRTPSFMEPSIPAGAMMPAPAFREGRRTSVVYLTLSEELLAEHSELSIPNMMIHEGIPGHHLQFATAAGHPSVIRRHADARDLSEGWTTMLEDYMLDQGYLEELADEARFVGKRDIARLGARVAIDLFFMTGEKAWLDLGVDCDLGDPEVGDPGVGDPEVGIPDPFVAAGALLQAVTGFVPGRVQAELNWYSQAPGYPLSYLAGNHLVWRLRKDVEEQAPPDRRGLALDREFHRVFLSAGNMPMRNLRRVFVHNGLLSS